jgi:hypothetical protein
VIAASIFDHPAVLLLIVFITLVRFLISKARSQTQDTTTPMAPAAQPITRGSETQTEEERVRKFLEALGQPAGSQPPKVTPRPRPVAPKIFPRLPPLKTAPPPLPPELSRPMAPPPLVREKVSPQAASVPSPTFEVHDISRESASEAPSETRRPPAVRFDQRIKLGSPQDLRTAIILREIFGPPRSFQPLDLTSGG